MPLLQVGSQTMRSASPNPSFSGGSSTQSHVESLHKSDPYAKTTTANESSASSSTTTTAAAAAAAINATRDAATNLSASSNSTAASTTTTAATSTTNGHTSQPPSTEANHNTMDGGGCKNNMLNASTSSNGTGARKPSDNLHSMINAKNLNEKIDKADIESFQKDWRHFECKTWHLEPTVRLLSWAGKSIEPYGIDYILNKLGFSHARTTIPKWLQRGFMDPLDKLEALLIIQLLFMVRDDRNNQTNNDNK